MTVHKTDQRPDLRAAIRRVAKAENPTAGEPTNGEPATPTAPPARQHDPNDVSGYLAEHFGGRRRT